MKNAIFVHGKPPRSRYENPDEPKPHIANWFPWISQQLTERGVSVAIPPLPKPYYPIYKDWKVTFESTFGDVGPVTANTGLVGHSAGAEFLLRWLSENTDREAERLVLVAPYRDYDTKYEGFSDYVLDTDLAERIGKISLLYSTDDDDPIIRRSKELMDTLPGVQAQALEGYGHFRITHNMTGPELPVLLDELTA